MRHFSKASRFKWIDASSVTEPGPPLVRLSTRSNILKFSMVRNSSARMMNGITIGSVTRQKVVHAEARSISAASYRYGGMERSPASSSSIT